MAKGHFQRGTVEGTGAAINIQLGWVPDYVKLFNIDDASTAPSLEWVRGMAAAAGFKNTTDTQARISSNGITAYEGTSGGNGKGFTIGADTDVNVSGETLLYVAWAME